MFGGSEVTCGRHEWFAVPHAVTSCAKTQERVRFVQLAIYVAMSETCIENWCSCLVCECTLFGHVYLDLVLVTLVCAGTTDNNSAYTKTRPEHTRCWRNAECGLG